MDIAKTHDIRELLLAQYAKEEAKLNNQQQDTEKQDTNMDSCQKEGETDSQVNKEFTEVAR